MHFQNILILGAFGVSLAAPIPQDQPFVVYDPKTDGTGPAIVNRDSSPQDEPFAVYDPKTSGTGSKVVERDSAPATAYKVYDPKAAPNAVFVVYDPNADGTKTDSENAKRDAEKKIIFAAYDEQD